MNAVMKAGREAEQHANQCARCRRRLDPEEQNRIFVAEDGTKIRERDLLAILDPNPSLTRLTAARKSLAAALGVRWQLIKR